MPDPGLKLITTEDGSHSLYREDLKESYHSLHGARGESLYVFIEQGLKFLLDSGLKEIRVFEAGLGTGLNAFLSSLFADQHKLEIEYHSVEPVPVPQEIYTHLNYGENDMQKALLKLIHTSPWEERVSFSEDFDFVKYQTTLQDFQPENLNGTFDIVYFDAFAPSRQAELWSLENLQKCAELLKTGGVLTTYCAQGQFKRNLAEVGFEVQTLKGAMRKKEMVRGVKR